jgi:sulfoxide reductase heme-binding subunit YedZ
MWLARGSSFMTLPVATVDPRAMWYLTRGTGVVAFLLLTAGVVLGVANVERWTTGNTPRFVIQRVHRDLSLVAIVFIVIHVATAVIDGFAPIRWIDVLVPFGSVYRPVWLGLGALAFDLVLAVVVTSLLRSRLGYGVWRAVHWITYAMWVLVVLHAAGVGSDTREVWMIALVAASVAAVAATVIWRLMRGWEGWEPARAVLAAGVVIVPPALAVWLVFGPLATGWAERAGTPTRLLATTTHKTSRVTTIVLPDSAAFSGSANLEGGAGEAATLATSAHTTGGLPLSLSVQLDGQQEEEGFFVRSGSVRLVPPDGAAVYRGRVTGVDGGVLQARLSDGLGDVIDLSVQMSISEGRVQGQLAIGTVASRQVPA